MFGKLSLRKRVEALEEDVDRLKKSL